MKRQVLSTEQREILTYKYQEYLRTTEVINGLGCTKWYYKNHEVTQYNNWLPVPHDRMLRLEATYKIKLCPMADYLN